MAIKFSQFVVETSAATMSHIVGYNGADNIQITPENFFTSFATGSSTDISYFSGSSILKGDSTTPFVYIDDTSTGGQPVGRMGLGTSSPNFKLDIAGGDLRMESNNGIRFGGTGSNNTNWRIFTTGTSTGSLSIGNSSSTPYLTISRGSSTTGFVGIGTSSPGTTLDVVGTLASSGITQLGTGGSNVLLTSSGGGNVGIGTASPGSKLEVVGEIRASEGSDYSFISTSGGDTIFGNISTAANNIRIFNGGAERMRIDSSGNVGIGTSSPSYKLDVYGDAVGGVARVKNISNGRDTLRSENAAGTRTLNFGNDGSGHGLFIIRDSSGGVRNYITGSGDSYFNGGNVGIGTTSPYAQLSVKDGTDINLGIKFGQTDPTAVMLNAYNDAVTANIPMEFRASKFNFENGKVGIGTTSPDFTLDITNTTFGNQLRLHRSSIASGGFLTLSANDSAANKHDYAKIGTIVESSTSGSEDGALVFQTSLNAILGERMRIDSSGNVGIGTTSPESKLTIKGNPGNTNQPVRITNVSTDAKTGLFINGTGNAVGEKYGMQFGGYNEYSIGGIFGVLDSTGGSTSGDITFDFGNGTAAGDLIEKVRFTHDGNVGVGTTSPSSLLSVGNAATHDNPSTTVNIATADTGSYLLKVTSDQFNADGNWVGIGLGYSNNYMKMGIIAEAKDSNARGKLHFAVNTAAGSSNASISDAKMTIDNAGKVGIGTTTPNRKFVVSNAGASGIEVQPNYISGVNEILSFDRTSGATAYETMRFNGGDFEFQIGGTEKMRIDSSGNVGIGTSTPTAKLTVVGLAEHADNSAAISAGLTTGAFYRTGDLLKVVH